MNPAIPLGLVAVAIMAHNCRKIFSHRRAASTSSPRPSRGETPGLRVPVAVLLTRMNPQLVRRA